MGTGQLHVSRNRSQVSRDHTRVSRDYTRVSRDYTQVSRNYTRVSRDHTQVSRHSSQVSQSDLRPALTAGLDAADRSLDSRVASARPFAGARESQPVGVRARSNNHVAGGES